MRGSVLHRSIRVRGCAQASRSSDFADARVCGRRIFDDRGSRARRAEGALGPQQEKALGPKLTPRWSGAGSNGAWARGMREDTNSSTTFGPAGAPRRIPNWAWERLHFFLQAREQARAAEASRGRTAPAGDHNHDHHYYDHDHDRHNDHWNDDDHAVTRRHLRASDLLYTDAALVHAHSHGQREQRLATPSGALRPPAGRSRSRRQRASRSMDHLDQ